MNKYYKVTRLDIPSKENTNFDDEKEIREFLAVINSDQTIIKFFPTYEDEQNDELVSTFNLKTVSNTFYYFKMLNLDLNLRIAKFSLDNESGEYFVAESQNESFLYVYHFMFDKEM